LREVGTKKGETGATTKRARIGGKEGTRVGRLKLQQQTKVKKRGKRVWGELWASQARWPRQKIRKHGGGEKILSVREKIGSKKSVGGRQMKSGKKKGRERTKYARFCKRGRTGILELTKKGRPKEGDKKFTSGVRHQGA